MPWAIVIAHDVSYERDDIAKLLQNLSHTRDYKKTKHIGLVPS